MRCRGAVRFCAPILAVLFCQAASAQTLITTNTTFDGVVAPFPTGTLDINGSSVFLNLLNGASLTNVTSLTVGNTQNGGLVLNNGSTFANSGNAFIGANNGAIGSVFFTGAAPATWNANAIFLGYGGRGTITMTNGGTINATLMSLGFLTTGSGTATISRSTSAVRLTNDLNVGLDGQGLLSINNGGTVVSNGSFVGSSTGGVGNITISGNSSRWTATSSILLGFHGQGTMTVQEGGRVQTAFLYAGTNTSGFGSLTVTGAGSIALVSSELRLGDRGDNTTMIGGGGQIAANLVTFGFNTTGSGSATLQDAGSRLTVTDRLTVGGSGFGQLLVTLSGRLVSGTAMLGSGVTGTGDVTISGPGTNWTVTNGLYIAGDATTSRGTGTVSVLSSGSLDVGGTLKIWDNGTLTVTGGAVTARHFDHSVGTFRLDNGSMTVNGGTYTGGAILTVEGAAASNNPSFVLTGTGSTVGPRVVLVGGDRHGTLVLSGGRTMTNTGGGGMIGAVGGILLFPGDVYLGISPGSTGTATVTGAGSEWRQSRVFVGIEGNGTLNILDGGLVLTTSEGQVVGTVTVSGSGSRWSLGEILKVNGSGTVTITSGGSVTSTGGNLGTDPNGLANVVISGSNSSWSGGILNVGYAGRASVVISDGGRLDGSHVKVGDMLFGWPLGTGDVSVSGSGSLLTSQTLEVGSVGTGTLNVSNGGRVQGASATLGRLAASNGTAMISGSNSLWTVTGDLRMAAEGRATLTVGAGGRLFTNQVNIANNTSGSGVGTASVVGVNSLWTVTNNLNVGSNSTAHFGGGSLTISGGGVVDVGGSTGVGLMTGTLTIGFGGTLRTGSIAYGDIHNDGQLVIGGTNTTSSYMGLISGTGRLSKTGGGTLTFGAAQTYTGGTTLFGGTVNFTPSGSILIGKGLYIHSGATFDNTGGNLTGTGMIVNNGTFLGNLSPSADVSLGGSGAFDGTRTIAAGATITPGESPGTQTVANEVWATGGNYLWEINDVDAGIGTDPGWDWLNVTNQLNITATGGGKFNILLTSLTLTNGTGFVHDFNQFSNYSWTIASAGGGVTGFDTSAFNLNTSAFQNSFGGTFGIALVGNDLALTYSSSAVPEPGSFLLVGAAAAGMAWRRRKRRGKRTSPSTVSTDLESSDLESSNKVTSCTPTSESPAT